MKHIATLSLVLSLSASSIALAATDAMDGMTMPGMAMNQKSATYATIGVVKKADRGNGSVTLAHDPVKSLNWPAMTMSYSVEDKMLFDKLIPGRKVAFEFIKQGNKYVVTSVK